MVVFVGNCFIEDSASDDQLSTQVALDGQIFTEKVVRLGTKIVKD